MRSRAATGGAIAAAGLMLAMIGGLSLSGRWPGGASLQRHATQGIISLAAERVARVEIDEGDRRLVFERTGAGWAIAGAADLPETAAISARLDTALRFLNVSSPIRTLEPGEDAAAIAGFGLDPPRRIVSLAAADGAAATVAFGAANPAQTAQYVRLIGQSAVHLLSRHVGAEWDLASDMAQRAMPDAASGTEGAAAGSPRYLVPVSLARIWAVEIVADGALRRFERDGAGLWFLHVGQHVHVSPADAHVADPARAPAIAAELEAFARTPIEQMVARRAEGDELARYGLARPSTIVLLYARDDSLPVARIEMGDAASDGFHRYARVRDTGAVVTVPGFEAAHLASLLRIAEAAP